MGLNLPESFMVGDSWRDVGAGGAAGCTTIQVRGLGEGKRPEYLPDYEVEDVSAAADVILQLEGS